MKINENIKIAKSWLLHSGIQNPNGEHKGTFNSWYDVNKKAYEYAYSEITGYGISTLVFLYNLDNDNLLLERARIATDWLRNKAQHKSGGILCRYFYGKANFMGSFENEEIFSFDCGMVLNGVTSLYRLNKDKRDLEFCIKLANFMINKMQKPDGSFYAVYDAKNEKLIDNGEKWSTQSGCLHAKLSIGLINLYEITKDKRYLDSAKKVCDNSLQYLQDDGRFITFSQTGDTLFHPHCYASEGLYIAGSYFKDQRYIEASRKSTTYLFQHQLKNGGIPSFYRKGSLVEHERTDILSQALRMGALFLKDIAEEKLQNLASRLLEFQIKEGSQKGGFIYGYDDLGNRYDHANSWCTMFAIQALTLLENKKSLEDIYLIMV